MTIRQTQAWAKQDAGISNAMLMDEMGDGSLLDLLAYEDELAAEAEAQVREHYAPLCDAETPVWQ